MMYHFFFYKLFNSMRESYVNIIIFLDYEPNENQKEEKKMESLIT